MAGAAPSPASPPKLVAPLFEGPIDIVADVHGESGALLAILDRMGYDANGKHAEGRRLVFVGDLVDRGPDSVTVVNLVKKLVGLGVAQMVLGNHELNLLKGSRKHGNHWWWGETETIRMDKKALSLQVFPPSDAWKEEARAFLLSLPLALERPGARVCHACWHPESIEALRGFEGDCMAATEHFRGVSAANVERMRARGASEVELELAAQNGSPVAVVTSGVEEEAPKEYFAGGKMRVCDRAKWWEGYGGDELVVFGHYWRRFPRPESTPESAKAIQPSGADPFAGRGATDALGPKGTAMCIDYSVGVRYEERGAGLLNGALGTALCVLRLPEMTLHFDDGSVVPVRGVGGGGGGKRQKV